MEAAITERTKAIVIVHYAGVACEMDAIMKIAERHGLTVIEDNAHGLGGSYRGTPLGAIGALATQSLHSTKNAHCGESGALVINQVDLVERERRVQATPHYQPLHSAPAGLRYGRTAPGGCPVTERVADQVIRLPLYTGLSEADVDRIVAAVTSFRTGA